MSSAAASFFSCTTCVTLDEPVCVDFSSATTATTTATYPDKDYQHKNENNINNDNMRRASSSRREMHSPPVIRSRSQERLGDAPATTATTTATTTTSGSSTEADEFFHDAMLNVNNSLTESTDNDSANELSVEDDAIPKHSNASKRGFHVRAMSDPFDTQEMQDALSEAVASDAKAAEPPAAKGAYPTLLRFPVAETRNKNCWSEPAVTMFSVRGRNYFSDKKKQTSGPYLLSARGTDIFLFDKAISLHERSHLILGGHLRSVPTLLINFQFPWGVMVLYFEVPAKLAPYLAAHGSGGDAPPALDAAAASLTPAEWTLAKWLCGDENYKNDRLKLIPYVAEGPWVVRNMVTGRPAIIGRKLPVTYRAVAAAGHNKAPLLEVTLDIGSSSATAKRIVSVCRRYMSGLSADIGFVIQAESPAELPEQMMGSIRVHGPDPLKAPKI